MPKSRRSPGNSVLGIPILGAKTADTTLQVKDGQTVVIGGLLGNNISRDFFRKLPWLGDIPGLGLLFRNKETQKDQTEVLFFMTPELVKDIDADTAAAGQTPIMKDWLGNWNAKVLKMPKKGYDWSLADPQGAGFAGDSKKAEKAEKAKAKTKVQAPAPNSTSRPCGGIASQAGTGCRSQHQLRSCPSSRKLTGGPVEYHSCGAVKDDSLNHGRFDQYYYCGQ